MDYWLESDHVTIAQSDTGKKWNRFKSIFREARTLGSPSKASVSRLSARRGPRPSLPRSAPPATVGRRSSVLLVKCLLSHKRRFLVTQTKPWRWRLQGGEGPSPWRGLQPESAGSAPGAPGSPCRDRTPAEQPEPAASCPCHLVVTCGSRLPAAVAGRGHFSGETGFSAPGCSLCHPRQSRSISEESGLTAFG